MTHAYSVVGAAEKVTRAEKILAKVQAPDAFSPVAAGAAVAET